MQKYSKIQCSFMIPFNLEKVNIIKFWSENIFIIAKQPVFAITRVFFCVISHDKRAPRAPGQVHQPNHLDVLGHFNHT